MISTSHIDDLHQINSMIATLRSCPFLDEMGPAQRWWYLRIMGHGWRDVDRLYDRVARLLESGKMVGKPGAASDTRARMRLM